MEYTPHNKLGRNGLAVYTIKYPFLWRRLHVWHNHPNGGPVFKSEASWRTASGVYLRIGHKIFSFQWRR